MTLSLTDFLLARIAEREVKARAARTPIEVLADADLIYGYESRGHWYVGFESDSKVDDVVETLATAMTDPAALLARCAVDRQIVERADLDVEDTLYPILRLLASLDADHPDYDKSWTI